ncbi:DUF726-domain-containing protein [Saitoella complicata NRRL Y-17804]|nr:DUF726-domain-containing protein [Saitoella complicata NRRL Y-17804]ODQ55743.1 DUF726-domain-containing protein [Saitoella complicata NRRL Y-17804]
MPSTKDGHKATHRRGSSQGEGTILEHPEWNPAGASEWSHQVAVGQDRPHGSPVLERKETTADDDGEWTNMEAIATYDMYDEDGRIIARAAVDDEDERATGAKGYTRVDADEDNQSATSMDENTRYLFDETKFEDDEAARTPLSQMQATKDLLTEGQRIAYVGICKLLMVEMLRDISSSKRKEIAKATESMILWSQKMSVRLYAHMEITAEEQVMIEQLSLHGVKPSDLAPSLMKNVQVANPNASLNAGAPPAYRKEKSTSAVDDEEEEEEQTVKDLSALPSTREIEIDLRWTVLCDLFLVLIADSLYDARSRVLLVLMGKALDVPWVELTKFEKRVTDALDVQEAADKNEYKEEGIISTRAKMAKRKRMMMMGLAMAGGGIVIGLSAGLLAPVIGAGLGVAMSAVGAGGATTFLAGTGGAALITTGGVLAGANTGVTGMSRRTQAVKTFEFRPLYNTGRVNVIITVSGWMSGKEDDVRLPFSVVDPVMGDIFSVLWEPEMLTSMGQTIRILGTEVLTQSLQQALGQTVLGVLLSGLQLPMILTKLGYLVDNPWSNSLDRAKAAGLIMADTLLHHNLGNRPVTLVGYSLGARVIFYCLLELAAKNAFGIVQDVYLFGTPVVVSATEYIKVSSIVAGRFVNGYSRTDWILGYLFRASSGGIGRVAGLRPVEVVSKVENVDCTTFVDGHMSYREAIPKLLKTVGWVVTSDKFEEIEDPDPDKHRERQRVLLEDLEEAKQRLPQQKKGSRLSWFGKVAGRSSVNTPGPEAYTQFQKDSTSTTPETSDPENANNGEVIFDIVGIRKELAKNGVAVKELKSTLPPVVVPSNTNTNSRPGSSSSGAGRSSFSLFTLGRNRSAVDVRTHAPSARNSVSEGPESDPFPQGEGEGKPPVLNLRSPFGAAGGGSVAMERGASLDSVSSPTTSVGVGVSPRTAVFAEARRPSLMTAVTTPTLPTQTHRNRHGCEDDGEEDFGGEGEITMSFA